MSRRTVWIFLVAGLLSLGTARSTEAQQSTTLGTIDFPVSVTSAEAKEHFLKGAMMLHSFEWEDATEAFQAAQQIEPDFAMAYWGEALSHTPGRHFPAGQDLSAAREVLSRLAETREERAAKAPTAREKDYLEAVEARYGSGDAQERALAYSEAMGQMHQN